MRSDPADLLASRVGALLASSSGRPVLVGVDGRSGSGKTELAAGVAARLSSAGTAVESVHLDDLYRGWDGLAAGLALLCDDVLPPLRVGRAAAYRPWDWHRVRPGPLREVRPADVVVVEGVGALAAPCAGLLDLRVWLDAPAAVRRARARGREGAVPTTWWDGWAAQEDEVFGPDGRPPADLSVDTVTWTARCATLDA